MIRYLYSEAKLAVPWGIFVLSFLLAVLRLTKVVSPEVPEVWTGWISFLEFTFPVLFPLLTFGLMEQEKRWRTLEVLVAAPQRKAAVFFVRYLNVLFPLFLAAAAAVRPREYLLLTAPGLALGGLSLLVGLAWEEEMGLGVALAWWGVSFALAITRPELLSHGVASWLLLVLFSSPLSPQEVLLRKWVHFGIGITFLLLSLVAAEYKRSWRPR